MTIHSWVWRRVRIRKVRVRAVRRGASGRLEYLKYKEVARDLVLRKLAEFNLFYNFKYNRISIKNHKSRWGSCSKKGNLNFNYRLALVPESLVDYVVVHELCHLGEFNHSKNFWNLVAQTVPNYLELRNRLHKINM
ncbi:TPA: M48 family peptidase [Candidatus Taylorbacteria bacterium]|nr:M48 family peptidase [Candidatus Taylorbacteria bacterium]